MTHELPPSSAADARSIPELPPWASGERGSRANNFDLLRMLMALGVIVSHAWSLVRRPGNPNLPTEEWLWRLTGGQAGLGGLCVQGFFVTSGYLIAASWVHSRSAPDYLIKRVRRIYPGFILATVVSLGVAVLAGASVELGLHAVVRRIVLTGVLQSVLVNSAFVTNPLPGIVNGSLWTIQYEFYCYLLIMLVGPLIVRRRGAGLVAVVMVLAALGAVIFQTKWSKPFGGTVVTTLFGWPSEWPLLASHFLAGTVFYIYRDRIPHRASLAIVALVLFVVGAALPPMLRSYTCVVETYLIMWVAFHPRVRFHHFGRYGDFSYGVYLYAFPIQQLLVYYGLTPHVWQNMLAAVPLSLLMGVLSWHLCEKHFLHFRVGGRRPDATQVAALAAAP